MTFTFGDATVGLLLPIMVGAATAVLLHFLRKDD